MNIYSDKMKYGERKKSNRNFYTNPVVTFSTILCSSEFSTFVTVEKLTKYNIDDLRASFLNYQCPNWNSVLVVVVIVKSLTPIIILRHIENMESKIFLSNGCVFLPDVCQLSSRKRANIGCSRV